MLYLRNLGICVGSLAFAGAVHGAVGINVSAGVLTSSAGTPISSGLVILAIDTNGDGFQLPTATDFLPGTDDLEVFRWDFSDGGGTIPGEFNAIAAIADYDEANWTAGDPLALFWYPSLDTGDSVPGSVDFGVFADPSNASTGNPWVMPADGKLLHSLQFFAGNSILSTPFASEYLAAASLASGDTLDPLGDVGASPAKSSPATNTVSWTPTGSAQSYTVERKLVGSDEWIVLGSVAGGSSSFEDDTLAPGRTYEYRVLAANGLSAVQSSPDVQLESERSVLANVSARSRIVAGNPATQMFGGLIIEGNDPAKNIVLQAIGRSFFSTTNFVVNPTFDVYNGGDVVASNDDWLSSAKALDIEGAMSRGSAVTLVADGSSRDSTELISAPKDIGNVFAVSSKDGDSGDVLLGIFDADSDELGNNDNRIVNLSARGFLSDESDSLFAGGMIIRGNVPKEVLVMAWGPYLSTKVDTSLDGATIVDPELVLFKGSDIVATNDNWETQSASSTAGITIETDAQRIRDVVSALGYAAFDDNSKDSVLLMTVEPGSYTFSFEGKGGTGIGLIAVEEVEID